MHWVPTAYIAGDIVGALSVHFLGAVATLRLIDFASLVAAPARDVRASPAPPPGQRGWALVGVLFGFSSHCMFGYI